MRTTGKNGLKGALFQKCPHLSPARPIAPAIKTAIVRLLGRALRRAQHALRRRHMKAALCTLLCSVILAAGLATGPHRRRIVTPELLLATAVPLPPFGCMRRRAGHI